MPSVQRDFKTTNSRSALQLLKSRGPVQHCTPSVFFTSALCHTYRLYAAVRCCFLFLFFYRCIAPQLPILCSNTLHRFSLQVHCATSTHFAQQYAPFVFFTSAFRHTYPFYAAVRSIGSHTIESSPCMPEQTPPNHIQSPSRGCGTKQIRALRE